MLAALFAHYAIVPVEGEEPPPWHRVETGRLSLADFVAIIAAELRTELGPDVVLPDVGADDLDLYLHVPAHWPTVALARRLRADGYRLAICTNNVAEWRSWRDSLPLQLFDVVVDSCEVGLRKPDPDIYRLTCDLLGVEPSEAVFCDDHPANVEAAEAIGMIGVHVTDDLVESLDRLEAVLRGSGR